MSSRLLHPTVLPAAGNIGKISQVILTRHVSTALTSPFLLPTLVLCLAPMPRYASIIVGPSPWTLLATRMHPRLPFAIPPPVPLGPNLPRSLGLRNRLVVGPRG